MKKLLSLFALIMASCMTLAQTYSPSIHTASNKSYGMAQAGPTDARSFFYDAANFVYRPYTSTAEVLSYLNIPKYREGKFDIIINTGGSLSNGVITGGTNTVWWFKDGTADQNLVRKSDVISVNGQSGIVVSKNADSLRGTPFDNSNMGNNYVLTYDSVDQKYFLSPAIGSVYTNGTGIDITAGVISALTSSPLWNANQLRGRNITTDAPHVGDVPRYDGLQFAYAPGTSIDTVMYYDDTLRIVSGGDTSKVFLQLSGGDAIVFLGPTLVGANSFSNPINADTINYIATKSDIARDSLDHSGDSIRFFRNGIQIGSVIDNVGEPGSGDQWGDQVVEHDATLLNEGTTISKLGVDTTGYVATKWDLDNLPGLTPVNISPGAGIGVSGTYPNITITNTGSPGENPLNALDIRNYGGVADVVIPGTGNNVSGTNNTPALLAMLNEAGDGQLCIVPNGKWLFSTPLDTIRGPKRVNLLILGDTYHNGSDFIIVKNQSGALEQHNFVHMGFCIGRVNMPTHSKTTHDNGTAPQWNTFTGTPFKIFNTYQVHIAFNWIGGFKNGIEIIGGGNCVGCSNGSQENTIVGRWLRLNANGITLTSLDGSSYCDKNVFSGWDGGTLRITGGLALKIDGFSGTASNGEIYNGAFRSNEFHFLIEAVDSAIVANGDITYNEFDVTLEGGSSTGIFGNTGFKMRSVAPNYVLAPKYTGQGVYGSTKMQEGMGINGEIHVPIWNGGFYFGNDAIIDDEGLIVFQHSENITQNTRNNAPANFRFVNNGNAEDDISITSSSYTVAAKKRYVYVNNASATITLPSASTYPSRQITIFNDHGSANLAVANSINYTTIPPGKNMTYRSNGSQWRGIINAEGTGGGGGGIFTADANGYTESSNLGIKRSSQAGAAISFPSASLTIASFAIANGVRPTTPIDGAEWREDSRRFFAANSNIFEYITAPSGISVGQSVRVAPDGFSWEAYSPVNTIYDGNGTIISSRTVTQNNNLRFTGSGEFQKFGGTFRISDLEGPTSGATGLLINGNIISGQSWTSSWGLNEIDLNATSLRYSNAITPVSGSLGLTVIGNTITGQLHNGSVWNSAQINTSSLNVSGSATTSSHIFDNGGLFVMGTLHLFKVTGTDANLSLNGTWPSNGSYIVLPQITANRVLTLPTGGTVGGSFPVYIIKNKNSSGNTWTTSANMRNSTDATTTTIPRGITIIIWNGTDWDIISQY